MLDGSKSSIEDFYPRSPCGERRLHSINSMIHMLFLSTLSLRRATWPGLLARPFFIISIHALLAESDNKNLLPKRSRIIFLSTLSLRRATHYGLLRPSRVGYFYPRSPCGERLPSNGTLRNTHNFYPRSPCGERPPYNLMIQHTEKISIHALLAESD